MTGENCYDIIGSVLNDTNRQREEEYGMDKDLFEYEMKKKGYKTPAMRAEALGWSLSAYYRRVSGEVECSKDDISKVADLLGWDVAQRIFFNNEVS